MEQEGLDLSEEANGTTHPILLEAVKHWGFFVNMPFAELAKSEVEKEEGGKKDCWTALPPPICLVETHVLFKTYFKPHLLWEAFPDLSR